MASQGEEVVIEALYWFLLQHVVDAAALVQMTHLDLLLHHAGRHGCKTIGEKAEHTVLYHFPKIKRKRKFNENQENNT